MRSIVGRGAAVAAIGLLVVALAACGSSSSPAGSPTTTATSSASSAWVKDTVNALDIYLPDGNSAYYLGGFGTAHGARTIITGRVPSARYWSYTMYPLPSGPAVEHIHDTQIAQSHGRYSVTIAATCSGVHGTCVATTSAEPAGVVVLRLYVPADLHGAETGGVALPSLSYQRGSGAPITLDQAAGTTSISQALAQYRAQNGALPSELTKTYPAPAAVPVPVTEPAPRGVVSRNEGKFNNPDNLYEHVRYTTTRGNLVVTAQAPTYQADSFPKANDLSRPATQPPQVRYWSLCIVLKDLHTGACLRDDQVILNPGSQTYTVIVSPTCPVAGYRNCLLAGPEPLQVSLACRYLLPTAAFEPDAFQGPYALQASYVARPD